MALLVVMSFTGCVRNPNLVFVTKGGIKAQGSIFGVFRKHEEINNIGIDIRELSEVQLHDLWVGLNSTNQTPFAEITEDAIKKIGIFRGNPSSGYIGYGYAFRFDGGQFVGVMATEAKYSIYTYPREGTAFIKLGSRKSGFSLSLPCSVDDFEKVFGKADDIKRGFGW